MSLWLCIGMELKKDLKTDLDTKVRVLEDRGGETKKLHQGSPQLLLHTTCQQQQLCLCSVFTKLQSFHGLSELPRAGDS